MHPRPLPLRGTRGRGVGGRPAPRLGGGTGPRGRARRGRVWGAGLVLWGEKDPFAAVGFGRRLAQRTQAGFVSFRDCSHWWQLERPAEVAAELSQHWAGL